MLPTILIVDDDADVLAALSETLASDAYAVICCTNPQEALLKLQTHRFAAVISDQNMPDISGLQLLEKVRDAQPDCSRLLITGMLVVDTLISAINSGEIYRFIAKPWKREEVVAAVRDAVQRNQLLAENRRLHTDTQALNGRLEGTNA